MRIKRGTFKRNYRKKILKLAKGYRMTYSRLYRRAKEAVLHAGQYSYAHRRHRGAQMRSEWIKIISAGLISSGMSYSQFVAALKAKNVMLDRKSLANIAINSPEHFQQVVAAVK
jgi:large subunit ribosomal protein L20